MIVTRMREFIVLDALRQQGVIDIEC